MSTFPYSEQCSTHNGAEILCYIEGKKPPLKDINLAMWIYKNARYYFEYHQRENGTDNTEILLLINASLASAMFTSSNSKYEEEAISLLQVVINRCHEIEQGKILQDFCALTVLQAYQNKSGGSKIRNLCMCIDLYNTIDEHVSDQTRAIANIALSDFAINSPGIARQFINILDVKQKIEFSLKGLSANENFGIYAQAMFVKAKIAIEEGKEHEATFIYKKIAEDALAKNRFEIYTDCKIQVASLLIKTNNNQSNNSEIIECLNTALKHSNLQDDLDQFLSLYTKIGNFHMQQKDWDAAFERFRDAINACLKTQTLEITKL